MSCEATKLVYSDGRPQWLMPDGSMIPAKCGNDGSVMATNLYLKDRYSDATRLIMG
ncbi:MAG: hypothetical protein LBR61_08330 [Synergistaceae bacterium]|jgi:hypothetical protein|nr:hypothetical protein [Synergistaceae bacterium]